MKHEVKKFVDELLYERGPHHQTVLQKLAERLRARFDEPSLFNTETEAELETYVKSNQDDIVEKMQAMYPEFQKLMPSHASGHEWSHSMDNINSLLRIFDEYGDFSESEKLETALACLGHDIGRYVEGRLDVINPKTTLFLAPALIWRMLEKESGLRLPEKMQLRILYDIATGSEKITGHRTADAVHQCDREQLMGSATIARGLGFDVGLAGRDLAIPCNDEFRLKLPFPESAEDRFWLVQCEFFMRNLYSPTSPRGIEIANANKRENAVILMLAVEGKPAELCEQIFGPELKIPGEYHWSKKSIPQEVFENAKKEKEEFLSRSDIPRYQAGKEATLARRVMAADHIVVPDGFDKLLAEKLEQCDMQERKNFWMILQYALLKRHEKRVRNLASLQNLKEGIAGVFAEWEKEELEYREDQYAQSVSV